MEQKNPLLSQPDQLLIVSEFQVIPFFPLVPAAVAPTPKRQRRKRASNRLRINEVAELLDCSRDTVDRKIKRGDLPERWGTRRLRWNVGTSDAKHKTWVFDREVLLAWHNQHE
jgi:excisionase family DNA binding protein